MKIPAFYVHAAPFGTRAPRPTLIRCSNAWVNSHFGQVFKRVNTTPEEVFKQCVNTSSWRVFTHVLGGRGMAKRGHNMPAVLLPKIFFSRYARAKQYHIGSRSRRGGGRLVNARLSAGCNGVTLGGYEQAGSELP